MQALQPVLMDISGDTLPYAEHNTVKAEHRTKQFNDGTRYGCMVRTRVVPGYSIFQRFAKKCKDPA